MNAIKKKRQYYHQLLIALGEAKYKEVIVNSLFNVDSTKELTETQLDQLIGEAKGRMNKTGMTANAASQLNRQPSQPEQKLLRMWRNKCLLVLNERGITATPKDWSMVNSELAKKQFQWVLTPRQIESGIVNRKGLYAFTAVDDLKKLFKQLTAIRDNEYKKAAYLKDLALKN